MPDDWKFVPPCNADPTQGVTGIAKPPPPNGRAVVDPAAVPTC